jgi:hypothetical protein
LPARRAIATASLIASPDLTVSLSGLIMRHRRCNRSASILLPMWRTGGAEGEEAQRHRG